MLARLMARVRGLTRRRQVNAEAADELRFHVEQETAANIARGVAPPEARRMALRDLGGLAQTREAIGDVRATWLDVVGRDVRHAVHSLLMAPGFTVVALSVLTLSIGATTAIFSVVDAVLLRRLPFHDANRLVAVGEFNFKDAGANRLNLVAPQNFLDWREQQDGSRHGWRPGHRAGSRTAWRVSSRSTPTSPEASARGC